MGVYMTHHSVVFSDDIVVRAEPVALILDVSNFVFSWRPTELFKASALPLLASGRVSDVADYLLLVTLILGFKGFKGQFDFVEGLAGNRYHGFLEEAEWMLLEHLLLFRHVEP